MSLVQLIYVSTAVEELPAPKLEAILESSVRHNREHGVTGMLLYAQGSFMQVLEGEEAAVDETYGRICQDPRHHQIILLTRDPVARREFASWSMGYKHLGDADFRQNPDIARLFGNEAGTPSPDGADASIALELLRQFANSQR